MELKENYFATSKDTQETVTRKSNTIFEENFSRAMEKLE